MNEAELVFTEVLNCSRASLYLDKDIVLDKSRSALLSSIFERRVTAEPIQYILGKAEFMGLPFIVNKNVFIPRPETEVLVEIALKKANEIVSLGASHLKILDLGTGSGCIAISLAKFLPCAKITGVDISQEVLKTALANARLNNVAEKTTFIESDLFTQFSVSNTQYDIIISNPPYIPAAEIESLQPEVKFEPRIALDGGLDGLDFYRNIARESSRYLNKRGLLIMEMGFEQRASIERIFERSENFQIQEVIMDYNNIDRVLVIRKKSID